MCIIVGHTGNRVTKQPFFSFNSLNMKSNWIISIYQYSSLAALHTAIEEQIGTVDLDEQGLDAPHLLLLLHLTRVGSHSALI